MMRDPTGLLVPRWSPTYVGTRLLVVLFLVHRFTRVDGSDARHDQPRRREVAIDESCVWRRSD
jgi:hypothetical protein